MSRTGWIRIKNKVINRDNISGIEVKSYGGKHWLNFWFAGWMESTEYITEEEAKKVRMFLDTLAKAVGMITVI